EGLASGPSCAEEGLIVLELLGAQVPMDGPSADAAAPLDVGPVQPGRRLMAGAVGLPARVRAHCERARKREADLRQRRGDLLLRPALGRARTGPPFSHLRIVAYLSAMNSRGQRRQA